LFLLKLQGSVKKKTNLVRGLESIEKIKDQLIGNIRHAGMLKRARILAVQRAGSFWTGALVDEVARA
jgi:hypothetical protein